MDIEQIAAALTEAGRDTVVTVDGTRWRYRIDYDPTSNINDHEYYGRVEPVMSRYSTQQPCRPAGFDGRARIMVVGRDAYRFWWQPPTDVEPMDADELRRTMTMVRDILEYGFWFVVVERLANDDDAYGCPIVDDYHGYGGIEPFSGDSDNDYHHVLETLYMMASFA